MQVTDEEYLRVAKQYMTRFGHPEPLGPGINTSREERLRQMNEALMNNVPIPGAAEKWYGNPGNPEYQKRLPPGGRVSS